MRLHRTDATPLHFVVLGLLLAGLAGCSSAAVGAPCMPEQIPSGGFDDNEAYIESSSVQCETRVCMVYKLRGDPSTNCQAGACSDSADVAKRVYCTCRCDAGNSNFATCKCPSGFGCKTVLEQGGPGVQGSYCVRDGT